MSDAPGHEERLAELVDEYLESMRHGKAPELTEFAAQHPEHADELRE